MHRKIIEKLLNNGYEAFYVGGYVRDTILDRPSYDIDIVTSARPNEIIDLFKDHKVDLIGKSFGVVVVDGIEVSTYRSDKYGGLSDKNVDIKYASTIEEDLSRRDFTINAIIMDTNGVRYDYHGGLHDLDNRIIRFIGDPHDRIKEDPNRIIRACRFRALLDGIFYPDTYSALYQNKTLVTYIAPERIQKEIMKVLSSIKEASKFFIACYQIGILKYILPSLHHCVGEFQGDYHKEPLFIHNMRVGDAISCKFPLLKLAGYLHDVGKIQARYYDEEAAKYHYKKHENIGALLAEHDLGLLKFSNNDIKYVCNVILSHMRSVEGGPKAYRKSIRQFDELGITYKDFLRMRMADRAGITKEKESPPKLGDAVGKKTFFTPHMTCGELRTIVGKFHDVFNNDEPFSVRNLEVNGHDVMEILNIEPSRKVGEVLNYLLELVIEDPEKNNREILIEEVKKVKNE